MGQRERMEEGETEMDKKTKGRCHVGPESLIDVMCSAARRQWFR